MFNISKIQIESNSQRHNYHITDSNSCVQYFKDTNRKQFTTKHDNWTNSDMLCSIFQRYKSKAIHNFDIGSLKQADVVFNISKIQIESNSQHYLQSLHHNSCCVQYFKDTHLKQFTTMITLLLLIPALCSIFQRYKSKAIHNFENIIKKYNEVVFNISKIQIESNSQRAKD